MVGTVLEPKVSNEVLGLTICRLFRAGRCVAVFLGLKPQTQSCYPFGITPAGIYRASGEFTQRAWAVLLPNKRLGNQETPGA